MRDEHSEREGDGEAGGGHSEREGGGGRVDIVRGRMLVGGGHTCSDREGGGGRGYLISFLEYSKW